MRQIDADKLMPLFVEKAHKMSDRHGVKIDNDWLLNYNDIKDVIDSAPTVEAVTVEIQIINEDGQSIDGYYDKGRRLIFTEFGIVGVDVLRAYSPRKYTMIEKQEADNDRSRKS